MIVRKLKDVLHQALAKAGLANDQSAAMILNRAGDNLGRGGGVAIYQDYQRQIFRLAAVGFVNHRVVIFAATLNRNDDFLARQKLAGYVDSLIQQSARIISQIQNQLAHSLSFQAGDRIAQLVISRVLETADQSDVTGARTKHECISDRRQRHGIAHDLEIDGCLLAGSFNFQQH